MLPRPVEDAMEESLAYTVREHVIKCSHIREYPRATASEAEGPLSLCIKQYTPINNPNPQPGDITVIGAHGSGLPKVRCDIFLSCISACRSDQEAVRSKTESSDS